MDQSAVPVWLLSGDESAGHAVVDVPLFGGGLTPGRVTQMRQALAAYLDAPLVTLEAHPVSRDAHQTGGRLLDAASPLARQLADLMRTATTRSGHPAGQLADVAEEVLYRMVVPAGLAEQLGTGLAKSMGSTTVTGGVYSAITTSSGGTIAGQAAFVPVVSRAVRTASQAGAATTAGSATGTAAAGGAAAVGGAAAGASLVTLAAPVVILAVATAASVYAEEQRRKAIERVTDLLKGVLRHHLEDERDHLTGAVRAIEKATAVVLDEGVIGHSLGLDSAVNVIDTAIARGGRRVEGWQAKLASFPAEGVDVAELTKAFPGVEAEGGEFRVHLRLLALAIALKRRVAILQAVDHAQRSPSSTFTRFARALEQETEAVDQLEDDVRRLLGGMARIQLRSPGRRLDQVMFRGEVNDLLRWPARLRDMAESEAAALGRDRTDVEILMVQQADGRLRVLPPAPAT